MIKKLILSVLGRERVLFLRSKPLLVNGKYRQIIAELESYSKIIRNNHGNDAELSKLLMRKFAHILDKGLHRKDVEAGHSLAVAKELKYHLEIIANVNQEDSNDQTIQWAKDKLQIYNELQATGTIKELKGHSVQPSIDFDTYLELIKSRRSNRQFLQRPVTDQTIEKLAETVNWASSSCNKQPIKLFATNNKELAKQCLNQCKGGTGFSETVPCFVAFCADMRGYYLPEEMYLPAIDVSLGAQNFFVACAALQLSATGLSWALKDRDEERRLREILKIPDYYQIIFNAAVGYGEKEYIQPLRKPLNNTLKIIK